MKGEKRAAYDVQVGERERERQKAKKNEKKLRKRYVIICSYFEMSNVNGSTC